MHTAEIPYVFNIPGAEWTAPDRGGPVIFHVAANAADGNESAAGDFVYTASGESAPPP